VRTPGEGAPLRCFECGEPDHLSRDCPQKRAAARERAAAAAAAKERQERVDAVFGGADGAVTHAKVTVLKTAALFEETPLQAVLRRFEEQTHTLKLWATTAPMEAVEDTKLHVAELGVPVEQLVVPRADDADVAVLRKECEERQLEVAPAVAPPVEVVKVAPAVAPPVKVAPAVVPPVKVAPAVASPSGESLNEFVAVLQENREEMLADQHRSRRLWRRSTGRGCGGAVCWTLQARQCPTVQCVGSWYPPLWVREGSSRVWAGSGKPVPRHSGERSGIWCDIQP